MAKASTEAAPLDKLIGNANFNEVDENGLHSMNIEEISAEHDTGYDGDSESQYPYKIEEPDDASDYPETEFVMEGTKSPNQEQLADDFERLNCVSEDAHETQSIGMKQVKSSIRPRRLKRTFSESTVSESELENGNGSHKSPPLASKRILLKQANESPEVEDAIEEWPPEDQMDVDDAA